MTISAGNDIVDLQAIDTARTSDPRFYSKFITGPEIELRSLPELAGMPTEHFVWLLWSVKESVYKFEQRHNPDLVFSPSKIIVGHINPPLSTACADVACEAIEGEGFDMQLCYNSTIAFNGHTFYSRSIITNCYIVTVVNNSDNFGNMYWGVKPIDNSSPAYQSIQVRGFILKKLGPIFETGHLNIIKTPLGCPILYNGLTETTIPVSLAHHGRYVAYAFHLANAPDAVGHSIS
ncbi:4'-phosphopantetheinyl transferase superfamily protein [Mucilaginibacter sp. KACC 22773]|uniref:4'-phosphopantetheinyl transferase family protein n=1 Tax=Mucilaginibacter sp. KACC 22773 TaxID=3025671 RepID=UPI0023653EC1|nr:4'-phosphopantetheinyl transferase superfamily protein [Mucilaginibacter sp. KACC 22773]WDF77971.1 4'-phosphopantetheinyl transferase superfamily protein [Mucilaginibacter sp. KACC 22773]